MRRPEQSVFGKGTNVLEYWLANSEGFTLARTKGKRRVTAVVIDPDTRQASCLVVQRSRRRTQVVAADAITAVDPHGRVLYVANRRRRTTPRPARAIARARRNHAGPPTVAPILSAARATRRHARASARRSAAQVSAGARRCANAAAVARAAGDRRLAPLRPLTAAYAHNAVTLTVITAGRSRALAAAWLRVMHEARLRGPWMLTSLRSSMTRAQRSLAAKSRTVVRWPLDSRRFPGMIERWRS